MVEPDQVRRVVQDAARLLQAGRLVVFGSGALAFWLDAPPRTRDVDVWCEPPERGEAIQALMGELSWYDEKHGAFVEVWAPETFAAPQDWEQRSRQLTSEDHPEVTVVIPHPHDIVFAKLGRMDPQDTEHIKLVHQELPFDAARIDTLLGATAWLDEPEEEPDRVARFHAGLATLRRLVNDG